MRTELESRELFESTSGRGSGIPRKERSSLRTELESRELFESTCGRDLGIPRKERSSLQTELGSRGLFEISALGKCRMPWLGTFAGVVTVRRVYLTRHDSLRHRTEDFLLRARFSFLRQ